MSPELQRLLEAYHEKLTAPLTKSNSAWLLLNAYWLKRFLIGREHLEMNSWAPWNPVTRTFVGPGNRHQRFRRRLEINLSNAHSGLE